MSSAQHITLQACNLVPTEVFAVNPDGSISAPGSQCIGISGTNVTAQPCTGVSTQKWTWLPNGCVASVADSSSCWNAWAGSTSPGTPISMFSCGSVSSVAANDVFFYDAQQMHIVGNESGLCFATATQPPPGPPPCTDDLGCSLNGVCDAAAGTCACNAPWTGATCGSLKYAVSPASGKNLWTGSSSLNTWNGPIMRGPDGTYHLYVPVYEHGSLWNVIYTAHGTAASVAGPYNWSSEANISSTGLNPAGLVFPNVTGGGALVYSLWDQADILTSSSPSGPFVRAFSNPEPSSTAPVFYGGAFYMTDQAMRTIITTKSLAGPWTVFANISLPRLPYTVEDPFLWVDKRGAFHIINHAYDTGQTTSCGSSYVSSHSFSADGVVWGHGDQPYGHTVEFDDGTTHTYCTLERPYLVSDDSGLITHIHLAADLMTGDEGCGPTPCVNCKYADHAGTLLVALG